MAIALLRPAVGLARPLVLLALVLVLASLAGCSGARHRKVTGPPPEYELPEEPDASVPSSPLLAPVRAPYDAGTKTPSP